MMNRTIGSIQPYHQHRHPIPTVTVHPNPVPSVLSIPFVRTNEPLFRLIQTYPHATTTMLYALLTHVSLWRDTPNRASALRTLLLTCTTPETFLAILNRLTQSNLRYQHREDYLAILSILACGWERPDIGQALLSWCTESDPPSHTVPRMVLAAYGIGVVDQSDILLLVLISAKNDTLAPEEWDTLIRIVRHTTTRPSVRSLAESICRAALVELTAHPVLTDAHLIAGTILNAILPEGSGDAEMVQIVEHIVRSATPKKHANRIIDALGFHPYRAPVADRIAAYLRQLMQSSHPDHRYDGLYAARKLRHPCLIPDIISLIQTNDTIAATALSVLGSFPSSSIPVDTVLDTILRHINHLDDPIRQRAIWNLIATIPIQTPHHHSLIHSIISHLLRQWSPKTWPPSQIGTVCYRFATTPTYHIDNLRHLLSWLTTYASSVYIRDQIMSTLQKLFTEHPEDVLPFISMVYPVIPLDTPDAPVPATPASGPYRIDGRWCIIMLRAHLTHPSVITTLLVRMASSIDPPRHDTTISLLLTDNAPFSPTAASLLAIADHIDIPLVGDIMIPALCRTLSLLLHRSVTTRDRNAVVSALGAGMRNPRYTSMIMEAVHSLWATHPNDGLANALGMAILKHGISLTSDEASARAIVQMIRERIMDPHRRDHEVDEALSALTPSIRFPSLLPDVLTIIAPFIHHHPHPSRRTTVLTIIERMIDHPHISISPSIWETITTILEPIVTVVTSSHLDNDESSMLVRILWNILLSPTIDFRSVPSRLLHLVETVIQTMEHRGKTESP
jgi:hypothetical protein